MLHLHDNLLTTARSRSPSESESEEERGPPSPVPQEESDEESPEKYPSLPNMKPTLQPVDESSQSSAPGSVDDEASRTSLSLMMNEESQHSIGPSREDSRLGFGAMKLGGGRYKCIVYL